jgi:hypothetical protein
MMARVGYRLILLAAIYIGLTWFFLGATHPCEIYYRIRVKPWLQQELKKSPKLTEQDKQMLPRKIHDAVHELPPAQCLWRTIAFRNDWTP